VNTRNTFEQRLQRFKILIGDLARLRFSARQEGTVGTVDELFKDLLSLAELYLFALHGLINLLMLLNLAHLGTLLLMKTLQLLRKVFILPNHFVRTALPLLPLLRSIGFAARFRGLHQLASLHDVHLLSKFTLVFFNRALPQQFVRLYLVAAAIRPFGTLRIEDRLFFTVDLRFERLELAIESVDLFRFLIGLNFGFIARFGYTRQHV
jgi:hypothetical protein